MKYKCLKLQAVKTITKDNILNDETSLSKKSESPQRKLPIAT
jgi:hypothetical protein